MSITVWHFQQYYHGADVMQSHFVATCNAYAHVLQVYQKLNNQHDLSELVRRHPSLGTWTWTSWKTKSFSCIHMFHSWIVLVFCLQKPPKCDNWSFCIVHMWKSWEVKKYPDLHRLASFPPEIQTILNSSVAFSCTLCTQDSMLMIWVSERAVS